jgi:hypothetical protein
MLSTLAANTTTASLESAGGRPTESETANALVDGFHVAWLGSAIMLVLAGVLLFALLRRRDVTAVAEGETAPAAV